MINLNDEMKCSIVISIGFITSLFQFNNKKLLLIKKRFKNVTFKHYNNTTFL